MMLVVALALLFAFTAETLMIDDDAHESIDEPPVDFWKHDVETRRKMIREMLTKHMSQDMELSQTLEAHGNWSLDNFINKYLAAFKIEYKAPDNSTIHNLVANNGDALFRPYIFEDVIKKYEIKLDDKETGGIKKKGWTFRDFIEKYEPKALLQQITEEMTCDGNETKAKGSLCIVGRLDSTDELMGLAVPRPRQRSGRRWRAGWLHPQLYAQLAHNETLENGLLLMKQAIYESRDRMVVMRTMRDEHRKSALYKMGYLFAKTDYACKTFSSMVVKSYRVCTTVRQKLFGSYRLYYHYMDILYNIERIIERWFDIDILKDILHSNDIIARKVILKDRNLTTPEMVVTAFDEMFID